MIARHLPLGRQSSLRALLLVASALATFAVFVGPPLRSSLRDWLMKPEPIYGREEMKEWIKEWEKMWNGETPSPLQEKREIQVI